MLLAVALAAALAEDPDLAKAQELLIAGRAAEAYELLVRGALTGTRLNSTGIAYAL